MLFASSIVGAGALRHCQSRLAAVRSPSLRSRLGKRGGNRQGSGRLDGVDPADVIRIHSELA